MNAKNYTHKSTTEQIRKRFDQDVERFSNLDTGQLTVTDAALCLDLITEAAFRINPNAVTLLDVGCGAGNFTLKMLEKLPDLECSLIDLSMPMLERAVQRVNAISVKPAKIAQEDILFTELSKQQYDIILAGAVLHHLRSDADWEKVFKNIYQSLKPGGSFWISDLISHDHPKLENLFKERYAAYLEDLGGKEYSEKVLEYIEEEDSPRSIYFQLDLMKKVGFAHVEVLHKNSLFAAFGAVK